ncbi:MAG: glycosyltransferase, partial [Eubacterium sp.]|nr:glycosyltransferase [Eubacterium sp.]
MEKNKKVSIIVPVYNVEKYLPTCIDSLVNQSYQNLEIILVDDGSKDRSGEICDEYARQDQRIIVIHKENGGLSDARNAGIDKASGDYLAFIDSDDWVDNSMIEKMILKIKETDSDVAICNARLAYDDYRRVDSPVWSIEEEVLSGTEAMQRLGQKGKVCYIIACNKLYKKKIFEQIRYPKGYIHEDEAVIHYVYENSEKVCLIPEDLYYYRQREDSIMGNGFSIKRIDSLVALSDRISFFHKRKQYDLENFTLKEYDDILWKIISDIPDFYMNKIYAKRLKRSLRRIIVLILKNGELSLG